ncbi:PadR family transcriptional regulator [Macrococcoides bohemicum]|uniref:PadR family transcriptional regulator n=1 Tax=Macrococcoides bohemicum TaxID=1903056 RepID=UPI00165D7BDC|nr:PadR family transcriptional regulator [Macrococcus bohemicus]MBC9873250.1 PadR family transcriptional regulator [Macrococcus bohemicus]
MNIQFKKGVLELIVLLILNKQDEYGYSLIKKITDKISISEGTVYPILRKLVLEEFLDTYFQPSNEGPARKYYSMTTQGKKRLNNLLEEWNDFINIIEIFIKENS